ncbi:IS3 family transposase [Thiomicrorhabdus sp.]|uniref:IS3 family transposase n=1 Tax=Thiomicrorhabdus sp. TaxID=2039724 RepID=UPI0029C630A4|nr:IS3 family transposase [Thiomicrorhabdus sp.]
MPKYTQPRKTWQYTSDFKVKAVKLSLQPGILVKQVAEALDIHPFMLSRWRKEYREGKLQGDNQRRVGVNKQKKTISQKELTENQKLKKEIARLQQENDLPKKVATVSGGTTSERFGFVQRYRTLGIKNLCNWLGVSTSGFYAWEKRALCERHKVDQRLLKRIVSIFKESKGRYGSPRVHQGLLAQGIRVGRKRVERLMREAGLKGRVVRVTRRQPGLKRFKAKGQNLRLDLPPPKQVNQVWVADITYLKIKGEWRYLATVMDLYSRRIVGWSLSAKRNTKLTCSALRYALKKRAYPKNIMFHTDRGIEYMADVFQAMLRQYCFKHSVNRAGYCTDNAHMESFFHSLKAELIRKSTFQNTKILRKQLATYINQFYNAVRLHSSLGYKSPIEYEQLTV